MRFLLRHLRHTGYDFWYHRFVPGYEGLDWSERLRLDALALVKFCTSPEALRALLSLTVWLLAGYHLVWYLDLRGVATAWPIITASVWLYPWLANARRRQINRLLGCRWSLY